MKHSLLGLMLAMVSACGAADQSVTATAMELTPTTIVTYEVPPATEKEVESVINSLLGVGEDGERIGRARVLPNRLVVVSAPPTAHAGIDEFVKKLWDMPRSEQHQRIRLHYWLVSGQPAASTQIASNLEPIETALSDLATTAGAMNFEKLDYVQHSLRSGASASVEGGTLTGHTDAATRGDRISLNVRLMAPSIRGNVRTEMDLLSGETVVLAQMGSQQEDGQQAGDAEAITLFIIRAENF